MKRKFHVLFSVFSEQQGKTQDKASTDLDVTCTHDSKSNGGKNVQRVDTRAFAKRFESVKRGSYFL